MKDEKVDLFKIAEETEEWSFLLNTITGVLSFTFAVSCFALEASLEKLLMALASLVFIFVLTISLKTRQNNSLKELRTLKEVLEKLKKPTDAELLLLKHANEALAYANEHIFPLRKVPAFALGFASLVGVLLLNVILFFRAHQDKISSCVR